MTLYRNPASGVVVDIPDELAESIGGYEPMDDQHSEGAKAPVPTSEVDPAPVARRARRKASDDD